MTHVGPRAMSEAAEQALRGEAKRELRTRMRGLRRVLPESICAAHSAAICERLASLPAFARAQTLIGYTAYKKEANPGAALARAGALGKTIGLVRVEEAGGLSLRRYLAGDALAENELGISEPLAGAPLVADADVEIVIVPALAVDARGQRIGYGQGYYDRLLPRLARAFKVVVAYDFQLLAELPNQPGDVPVDCIVTEKRVLEI